VGYLAGLVLVGWGRKLIDTISRELHTEVAANLNPNLSANRASTGPFTARELPSKAQTPNLLTPLWFRVFPFWLAANTLYFSFFSSLLGALAWTVCLGLLGVLALVDARTGILPNEATLPLLLLGLAWQAWLAKGVPDNAFLWGVVMGYGVPRLFNTVGHWMTGRDVLGEGDAKLLSGMGAWLGVSALPTVWVIASLAVLVYTAYRRVSRGGVGLFSTSAGVVPFGPFLVFGMNLLLVVSHV